jgi:tripartite-type tricarboxylate transporter receptor subunit TctC
VVDAAFLPLAAGVPDLVRAGRLQLLAVAATERVPGFAQVPTWEELGLDGFVHRSWSALLVPATVPAPALERLRAAAVATVQDGAVHQQLAAMGLAPVPLATDAEAQSFLAAEVRRYRGLAAAAARAVP